jgi:Flp pilus assembly pilin Flp
MMKIAVKRLIRDEKGAAMELVLILLLVSGLIAAPLLSHMGSGVINSGVYETRTAELYAADAGVEDALWRIQHGDLSLCPGNPPYDYSIPDVNGKSVNITVTSVNDFQGVGNLTGTYRIESTATGDDSGTGIDAYIEGVNIYGDYGDILGQVLTSQEEIDLQPNTEVYPPEGEECGPVENYLDDWPTAEELIDFYLDDVEGEASYDSDMLEFDSDMELGPFYREGDLEIKAGTAGVTLTLTGTTYVSGDTLIGSTGQDFTLNLNDCTIFVASNSSDPQKALWIGGKCTVVGSGVIIAIGDMYFEPNTEAGVTDPIFVMSVLGTTNVQPGGDFYGSIAGSVEIQLQPGTSINYPESGGWSDELNFLIGVKKLVYSIDSWEISQQ